jgi:DNA-binding transcriptional LysR family regulator
MLNADHLRTFLAVADGGSYTAAAAHLGFTQPAVSQQIHALEAQLGDARLFRRVGKQMHLTHAGEELLSHAREVVALTERAERHILGLQGYVVGRITLGCTASSGERLLGRLLTALYGRFKTVQIVVEVGPAEALHRWLAAGTTQAILLDEHPRRRSLDVLALGQEPVICVAARGHPVFDGTITTTTLRDLPLIVPQRGTALRRMIEDYWRRRIGLSGGLSIAIETDSVALALEAAGAGLGLAFVPQSRVPRGRELAAVTLPELKIDQSWFLVRSRGIEEQSPLDEIWNLVASAAGRKLLQGLGLKEPRPPHEDPAR